MKILVLEDDPLVQRAYSRMLKDHQVRMVGSPAMARAGLELDQHLGAKPSLIISDWNMPGETGGEFCRSLRAAGDETPVIIVSGEDRTAEAKKVGANASLMKPFGAGDLLACIRQVCG